MNLRIDIFRAFIALLTLSLIGCKKDDTIFNEISTEREMVECCVNIGIKHLTSLGNTTRSEGSVTSNLPNVVDDVVKNVWILQYDEKDNFIGTATYIDNLNISDQSDNTISDVNFLNSNGLEHNIVFIANTFDETLFGNDNRASFSTLELVKELNYPISTKDGDTYVDNFGLIDGGDDSNYIIMSDIVKSIIENEDIKCDLEYNLAKISVKITNKNKDYIPKTITLKGVPAVATYLTGYDLPDEYPTKDEFKPTDYNSIDISSANLTDGTIFEFYMPANMRGEVKTDDVIEILEENKPLYADNYNTYIEIDAHKQNDSSGDKARYKFYLGANLTTDFNLKPNYQYEYDLTIKDFDQESALVDSRVDITNDNIFDYTREKPSNCYILNPSLTSDRIYYIPITKRINEFWGGNGYEDVASNVIYEDDTDYTVDLNWHDYRIIEHSGKEYNLPNLKLEDKLFLEDLKDIVTFNAIDNSAPSGQTAMKVTLKKAVKEGNVSVNIVRDGRILWSWHFWITDYNPYSTAKYKNKYAMTVDGGEIHSYAGEAWEGAYAGHYIMDRDIGAKNNNDGSQAMLYQYGRKDPFRVFGSVSGNSTSKNHSQYGYYQVVKSTPITVIDMVYNPTSVYTYDIENERYIFPITGKYNSRTNVWCDPKIQLKDKEINKKSIFDPSPLGWMIPTPYIWEDFGDKNKSASYRYVPNNTIIEGKPGNMDELKEIGKCRGGRFYNPSATTLSNASYLNYLAYYPENGTILSYDGNYQFGGSGYDWTSNANTYNNAEAYMMLFRTFEYISPRFSFQRWNARAVRPVTE